MEKVSTETTQLVKDRIILSGKLDKTCSEINHLQESLKEVKQDLKDACDDIKGHAVCVSTKYTQKTECEAHRDDLRSQVAAVDGKLEGHKKWIMWAIGILVAIAVVIGPTVVALWPK